MAITKDEVKHVANLARLKFTDEELEKFSYQLDSIIEYVNKLNELSTDDVQPTAHIVPISNVFRDDEVKPSMEREKVLMNAPEKENGCFKVPKVIE
ncbi:Asp-tRNA(Asn)/Glu-tRNA(Gln) amidotransferase subunit GatC [Thermoanaerobacterium sp. RBIITD]|uniref:Asp-tRNA(Asn)/Glu-tRNA(Gln) amidotransferase subunit GatC n=1 Tax=Thermoanaerobacterium sp. RBIITD TaxID=1550240 RepID=UPI000BB7A66F|nr:Asp-tRNA(Asn)/Glu-tRNA(Gln) amidotransferase subunit GatC [Thermoanaerobacterium sp. RBIITD]SNX53010.1 aspartyl/glutamyl-tRNA(Asn/Gln) amidotransferase subunit C [Thermoanaerobacterium sp. RBIITD]